MSLAIPIIAPELKRWGDRSLVWHLAVLALGAAAPFAALAAYLAIELIRNDMAQATVNVEQMAQSTALRAARLVDRDQTILAELAARPDVRALDPARCDPLLKDLMRLNPDFANVFTLDVSGRRICSAAYRLDASAPPVDPRIYLDQVKARKSFIVGRPTLGRLTNKWIISAVQPVFADDGSVAGVVGISISLLDLAGRIQKPPPGREPVLLVVDSAGVVLTHHPDPQDWMGRDVSASPAMRMALARRSGSMREKGVLGVERLWAFAPVRGTDWTVLSGIPMQTVMAPSYRAATWVAALAAASIAFVIALCIALTRPISRPIAAIAAAARRMSSDDSHERLVLSGPSETVALAEDLNRMLDRRMSTERELRERENELSQVTDNYPGWVMHLDCDLRFRYASSGYLEVTGLSMAQLLGTRVRDVVGDSRFPEFEAVLARALAGERQSFEVERKSVAGTTLSLFTTIVPNLDAQGKVDGLFVFASDITQLRQAETRLNNERKRAVESVRALNASLEKRVAERTADLEAVNRELESFDYSISHDLRAPIDRIRGFSEALLEDADNQINPQTRDFLGRIQASAASMDQLVTDMLSLSTLSRSELHRADVDLSATAREVLETLQRTVPGRVVEWVVAEGVHADADPGLMRVVLENLLGNAWKFTSRREGARIEFGADLDHGVPRFFVRDNGAGFDAAFSEKLFEPFARLHAQGDFPGTGIGLATVKRILRRHGGRAWAEGVVDQGATVFFTLSA